MTSRRLVLEAACWLSAIRAGLAALPFSPVRRLVSVASRSGAARRSEATAQGIGAAVAAASRRLPGTSCLVQAMAGEAMLRRRGYAPTLKLGVRAPSAGVSLDAHAWLECAGVVVVGGPAQVSDYVVLTARQ